MDESGRFRGQAAAPRRALAANCSAVARIKEMTIKKGEILVIDDEEVIRSGCQQILEMSGYSVAVAENGRVGLDKIIQHDYDIILTDIMMPEMDGMELLDEIGRLGKELVVIVITGYATLDNAITAGRKGAYDYLPKPFNPDELLAKIERGLDYRAHLREVQLLRQDRDRNMLECSNERARTLTIINSMSEGVLAINRQGQIVLMNPMASKIMRLSEERAIGRTVDEIVRNPDLKKSIVASLQEVQAELSSTRLEFDTVYGRAIEASITPIIDENKECIGTVAVLIDVTEDKKIEKMKSDFVSYVAHELKAPLGAIEGYLNLILDGITADKPQTEHEMIEKARDRAHGLIALINDLLDLSRTDRKKSLKEMHAIDVEKVVREAVEFYRNRAEARSQHLTVQVDGQMPLIRANEEDLFRLYANLISNAIKYTPENGDVRVEIKRTKSHVRVDVIDTGIGISGEAQKHIFDEFYRAQNAVDKKITGTGLGLSIAKKIAEDHHGYIDVTSEEGVGSTFRVTLPIIQDE
ncbi:response regulator [candidate division KSB1 bacterium]|nr:response regulator [candidate division KSB1 bacterium]RQW06705.1 MAG: response regulator [candidate division KSB1 bacterium]